MMTTAKPILIDYVNQATNHELHLPLIAFKKPVNQKEYNYLEKVLDQIMDEVRDNEDHPLALAMQIIGDNIENFDDKQGLPIGKNVSDVELVQYLMENNNLCQREMVDIFGNQGNVSKFLNGERQLSKAQITRLAIRFTISTDFFFK